MSDAVAINELGSAVALTRDNAVPDQLRWQVHFFSHFNPLCCEGKLSPGGRNSKALKILKDLLALISIALIALLGAGCQDGEAAYNQGGTTGEPSSAVKQTLAISKNMIATTEKMEAKIAARKEAYASTGNPQGEQLMEEAGKTTEDIDDLNKDINKNTQAIIEAEQVASTTQATPAMAFIQANQAIIEAEQVASTTQATPDMAFIQAKNEDNLAKNEEIQEKTEHLEDILNEARDCCGLEPDFLSQDLQELRTQTATLENLGAQIEAEQTVPERAGPEQTKQAGQQKAAPQQPKSPPAPTGEAPPAPKEVPPPPPPETPPAPTGEAPPALKEVPPLLPPEPPPPPPQPPPSPPLAH